MPETETARNKIVSYKENNNITYMQLALMVGLSAGYVQEVITGKKSGKKANELILKIIQMFGIS